MSYLGRTGKLSQRAYKKSTFLATAGQTLKTGLSYSSGSIEVYINGLLMTDTVDYTATNGNSVTFIVALTINDEVTIVSLKTYVVADHYTRAEVDSLLNFEVDGGVATSTYLATQSVNGGSANG
jgi:hypothetical protein|tara:strand:+ start:59 stop:430 length:372 start_codon:yes stop_codon:yes gene_type:complete